MTEIPPAKLLSKYKDIIVNVEKQKSKILKENQQLSQLRDWLLPMLMNGQVSISEAYRQVEEELSIAAEGAVEYEMNNKRSKKKTDAFGF